MDLYVELDVSLKETSISVRQNRKRIWRGKCLPDPQLVAEMIRKHAPDAVLAVFETGPLATWFHRKLTARRSPGGMQRRKTCEGGTRKPAPRARSGRIAMDEDHFNIALRKFLKVVGVTSQREIERVVREGKAEGAELKLRMTLAAENAPLNHIVEETFDLR